MSPRHASRVVRGLAVVVATASLLGAGSGAAQWLTPPDSPILTLNDERLFEQSRFGKRVLAELEAEQAALAGENRQIEARLVEEERLLTERRALLSPEEFRVLADEFDSRVEEIRRNQDAKARALLRRRDEERQRFLAAALPVLTELMRDAGAVAILSEQAIVLAFDRIDITDAAIARLDAVFGDGRPQAPDTDPTAPADAPGDHDGSAPDGAPSSSGRTPP